MNSVDEAKLEALAQEQERAERISMGEVEPIKSVSSWDTLQTTILNTPPKEVSYWVTQIDTAASDVYAKSSRFSDEYKANEADALAYKTANYSGTLSTPLQTFASATGLSAKQAVDMVLTQAEAFRKALDAIRTLRMKKFAVAKETDVSKAEATAKEIVTQIRAIGEKL